MEPEEEVLRRITPTPEEEAHLQRAIAALREAIARRARGLGLSVEPTVVGSVAKGTHLKDPDVDLFVGFLPTTPRDELKRDGLELGKILEGGRTMYAEHPYTRGKFMGVDVEVVPYYRLERATDHMSAVDRTPFHTAYVTAHLTEPLRASIRLLKQFCKGVGIYGAEAKVQGFSGYLCELLVLRYGGLRELLEASRGWRPGSVITLGPQATREFPEPLAVVDPVDPGRNVASAVSLEQMATFVLSASEYLQDPRMAFFFPPPLKPWPLGRLRSEIRKRDLHALEVRFKAPDVTDDVLFPQLRKCEASVVDLLQRHGFSVKDSLLHQAGGNASLLMLVEVALLPAVKRHQGPPPWVKNAQDFLAKWTKEKVVAGPYMRGEHIVVDVPRDHRRPEGLLGAELPHLSLGRNVDEAVAAGFTVLSADEVVRRENALPLTDLLTREFPWRRG